jgi:hypothetical protein
VVCQKQIKAGIDAFDDQVDAVKESAGEMDVLEHLSLNRQLSS